jgi:environmental stress-induced protein Ves
VPERGWSSSAQRLEDPVRRWVGDKRLATLRVTGTNLRRRLGVTAAAIAATEDQVACTLEHLAHVRPHDAARLRARAAQARQFAAEERDRAAVYGSTGADAPS